MPLNFAVLYDGVKLPSRKHPSDAGVDVYASKDVIIPPFTAKKVPTGVTFEIPTGSALFAWPKSGSDFVVGGGVIDAGYQGEIFVKLVNYGPEPLVINQGDPVAQLVYMPVFLNYLEQVSLDEIHREKTDRGSSGGIVSQ